MSIAMQAKARKVVDKMSTIEGEEYRDGWIGANDQVLSRIPHHAPEAEKIRAVERAREAYLAGIIKGLPAELAQSRAVAALETPQNRFRPWRLVGHLVWIAIAAGYILLIASFST